MEKLNKKLNRAICLSIIAIALSAIMFILWCCNAGGFSAVNLDTFVGVIVALLAIIVTIAIGWQIWAAMDLKSNIAKLDSSIREIENLKKQFEQQQNDIKQLTLKNQHATSYTWSNAYIKEKDWFHAFRFLLISLYSSLQLEKPVNIAMIFSKLNIVAKNIQPNTTCNNKRYEEVVLTDKNIRSLNDYSTIEDRYIKLYKVIFANIKVK